MEAEDAATQRGRRGDLRDRQGARVGREQRAVRRRTVEHPEDRSLGVEVLQHRFDHELRAVGRGLDTRRVRQEGEPPRHPFVRGIGIQLETGRPPFEPGADPRPSAVDRLGVDIVEEDLVTGFDRQLGDARAHRPRPDHADDAGHAVRPT